MELKCKHYKGQDEAYEYELNDDDTLTVCDNCNRNLAADIMREIAIQTFSRGDEEDEEQD